MTLDRKEISKHNIMERWLKDSLVTHLAIPSVQITPPTMETADKIMKNMLLKKVLDVVSAEKEISDDDFQVAIETLNRMLSKKGPQKINVEETRDINGGDKGQIPISSLANVQEWGQQTCCTFSNPQANGEDARGYFGDAHA